MPQYKTIPQLVFGDHHAEKFNNVTDFGATFDRHAPRLRSISGLGRKENSNRNLRLLSSTRPK